MKISAILTAGALALGLGSTAHAATLTLDGGFSSFSFDLAGSSWSDSFDFTIVSDAYLWVTDAFLSGDRFEVFANNASLGLTSVPGSLGDQIGGDFAGALADSRWSSGEFLLTAGSYTITGIVVDSPFGSGDGGIALSSQSLSPVPLPAGGLLLIGALAGLGMLRRKLA